MHRARFDALTQIPASARSGCGVYSRTLTVAFVGHGVDAEAKLSS